MPSVRLIVTECGCSLRLITPLERITDDGVGAAEGIAETGTAVGTAMAGASSAYAMPARAKQARLGQTRLRMLMGRTSKREEKRMDKNGIRGFNDAACSTITRWLAGRRK